MKRKNLIYGFLFSILVFTLTHLQQPIHSLLCRRVQTPHIAVNWNRFEPLIEAYRKGEIIFSENNPISGTLEPFPEEEMLRYEEVPSDITEAEELIGGGGLGIIYLAGGAGTRLGLKPGETKATHAVVAGYAPIEVLCMDITRVQQGIGGEMSVFISTSAKTDNTIATFLEEKGYYDLSKEQFFRFQDESSGIRFVPHPEDLEANKEALISSLTKKFEEGGKVPTEIARQKAEKTYEELLAFAQHHEGKTYLQLLEEGVISDPKQAYCGTGNDILASFVINGGLEAAIRKGVEVLMIRNDANFGATVDPKILEAFLVSGLDVMAEMVPKKPGEVGGVAALVDGRPAIVEVPQIPSGVDQDIFPDFNTNTIYIKVDAILKLFGFKNKDEFLEVAKNPELLRQRVWERVAEFPNIMVIRANEIEGQFIPTLEFQNILGPDLSQAGLKIGFIRVHRDSRYLNVKRKKDLTELAPYVEDVAGNLQPK